MRKPHRPLPYFDALLELLDDYPMLSTSFGRHVHWGFWDTPPTASPNAEEFAHATERLTRLVCDAAAVGTEQQILDVGCGFGGTLASLNERFDRMALYGLNIEYRQLARARQRVSSLASNRPAWVNGNACELPFADQSLDVVLAVECIFHFPSRRDFFREAFRVLKPGGRLALSDFIATPLFKPAAWLMKRWPSSDGFYGECDVQFTWQDYRKLAQETGFDVCVALDITRNILPTYVYLHDLRGKIPFNNISAAGETLFVEFANRTGLLQYGLLGLQKPS